MKPHEANGGPGRDVLIRLQGEGMGSQDIAARYGVARQTVDHWMKKAGMFTNTRPGLLSHRDMIPWQLKTAHHNDGVARGLRAISRQRQGADLDQRTQNQAAQLLDYLARSHRVVQYSREDGFTMIPFDPEVDEPGALVRRPPAN